MLMPAVLRCARHMMHRCMLICTSLRYAALALLPDDDDEDLVIKAKENRKSRLKSEITTQKQFARTEGFKDMSLAPLQKAVTQLARVGAQLSSGDVSAASGTLK